MPQRKERERKEKREKKRCPSEEGNLRNYDVGTATGFGPVAFAVAMLYQLRYEALLGVHR